MRCSVEEARERVNSPQFTRWRAFWRIYPPLEERVDIATGILKAAIYNAAGGKSGGGTFDAAECIPDYFAPYRTEEENDADLSARIHQMFASGMMDPRGDDLDEPVIHAPIDEHTP